MLNKKEGVKKKAVAAIGWVGIEQIFTQGFRLASNLILTRMLMPELFGLMAVASVVMAGMEMFSDLGLNQNIIQSKRSGEEAYLNTAWSIQIIRGCIISVLVVVSSLIIYWLSSLGVFPEGSVYADPRLPIVVAAFSIAGLLNGFCSMNLAVHNRNLVLKYIVVINIVSQIASSLVMILLAWYAPSIWVLVIGGLSSAFCKLMLSHAPIFGKLNRPAWDKSAVNEILHFGKWIFLSSIFTFIASQGDRLIFGALISPAELGVYTVALVLAKAPYLLFDKVVAKICFPIFSSIVRERPGDLKTTYYEIRRKVDVLVMLSVGFLASTGHIFVEFLYDSRYEDAGWMFELLILSSLFVSVSVARVCLMALGNTFASMVVTSVSAVSLFILIPVCYSVFGLYGAVLAIALNSAVELPVVFFYLRQYGILELRKEFKFYPLLIVSAVAGFLFNVLV